jgi:hypothetical protein
VSICGCGMLAGDNCHFRNSPPRNFDRERNSSFVGGSLWPRISGTVRNAPRSNRWFSLEVGSARCSLDASVFHN